MLRRSRFVLWGQAPAVYPFPKPFHDTPFDEDRHRLDRRNLHKYAKTYPAWMDKGYDGTGRSIGLYRAHPLSPLQGSLRRTKQDVPRIFRMMTQGVPHASGVTLYYRGGKVPKPNMHPYLTGEPCPVYGWKVLDYNVIRQFDAPQVPPEKARYKAYVALQERRLMGPAATLGSKDTPKPSGGSAPPPAVKEDESKSKPLLKRLFFWR